MKRGTITVTLYTEDAKAYDVIVYYGHESSEDIEIYKVLLGANGTDIFDTLNDDDVTCIIDCIHAEHRSEWLSNDDYYRPLDPTESPVRITKHWEESERD